MLAIVSPAKKMDFDDWVERQIDCDEVEQKILNYYDNNAEEIDLKLDYKLIENKL